MRNGRFTILLYGILALMTAGYCWMIWLGMGAFQAALPLHLAEDLPWVSRLAMAPLFPFPFHALHWQVIAVLIVGVCGLWGSWRYRDLGRSEAHLLPALLAVGWILQSVCWHVVGVLAPMVTTIHVLE